MATNGLWTSFNSSVDPSHAHCPFHSFYPLLFNLSQCCFYCVLLSVSARDICPLGISCLVVSCCQVVGDSTFVAPAIKLARLLSRRSKAVFFYTFNHVSALSSHPLWMGMAPTLLNSTYCSRIPCILASPCKQKSSKFVLKLVSQTFLTNLVC